MDYMPRRHTLSFPCVFVHLSPRRPCIQIAELQETSGCRMGVKHAKEAGCACVHVTGTRRSVDAAMVLIKYTIETFHDQRDKQVSC